MKKVFIITSLAILSFGFYSFMLLEITMENILKQLDISEAKAKEQIWSDISYKTFYFPSPKSLRSTPDSERQEIVKVVGNFVKAYTRTDEFTKRYKEYVSSRKPQSPQKPESMEETRKKQKEQLKKTISDMEVNKKKMPADQQATFEATIKMLQEQLKEIDNPDNPMYNSETDKFILMGYEEQMKDYKEKLAQWEQEYNSAPDPLVREWLETFLELTESVDFNAALKMENGKKRFVNQEYERKPNLWKLCFRVGKPVTEAARSFAKSWYKELK